MKMLCFSLILVTASLADDTYTIDNSVPKSGPDNNWIEMIQYIAGFTSITMGKNLYADVAIHEGKIACVIFRGKLRTKSIDAGFSMVATPGKSVIYKKVKFNDGTSMDLKVFTDLGILEMNGIKWDLAKGRVFLYEKAGLNQLALQPLFRLDDKVKRNDNPRAHMLAIAQELRSLYAYVPAVRAYCDKAMKIAK